MLIYFEKDDGNEIVLKTLRKTKYVQDFFDNELEKYTRYSCGGNSFYYIEQSNTAVYKIDVTKDFAIKTVRISYAQGNADCLCETPLTGKEASELCNK